MAERILVVEDEVKITRFLRQGLTYEGYEVTIAYDGEEAEIGHVVQQALSYPMMCSHQVICVKRAERLVGDSLANVVLGYESTPQVTMDEMIHHASAVRRGAPEAFVVLDMPFLTYQVSPEEALARFHDVLRRRRSIRPRRAASRRRLRHRPLCGRRRHGPDRGAGPRRP